MNCHAVELSKETCLPLHANLQSKKVS